MTSQLPTTNEIKAMRNGDRETINRLYTANYPFIMTVCKAYCRNATIKNDLFEDMAQECYLYFDQFEFSSIPAFIRNVRDVCLYARWGGERVYHQVRQGNTEILTILDEPTGEHRHGELCETLGETLPAATDILEEIYPPPDYAEIVHDIALKYLTPRQKEAFEYFYYTDMTAREVGEILGININGAQSLKTGYIYRLRKHADELREELLLNDIPA